MVWESICISIVCSNNHFMLDKINVHLGLVYLSFLRTIVVTVLRMYFFLMHTAFIVLKFFVIFRELFRRVYMTIKHAKYNVFLFHSQNP